MSLLQGTAWASSSAAPRAFLGTRGIVLGHAIHLIDGNVDLLDPLGPFRGGGGNLATRESGPETFSAICVRESPTFEQLWTCDDCWRSRPRIFSAVSFAAAALRCARDRTSSATTAKPAPASPARAAHRRVQGEDVGLKGDLADVLHDLGHFRQRRRRSPPSPRSSPPWCEPLRHPTRPHPPGLGLCAFSAVDRSCSPFPPGMYPVSSTDAACSLAPEESDRLSKRDTRCAAAAVRTGTPGPGRRQDPGGRGSWNGPPAMP